MKTTATLLSAFLLATSTGNTSAQVILSDSFDRTLGSPSDPEAIPPQLGMTDWGQTDNGLGGTVSPVDWIPNPGDEPPRYVDGDRGILQNGRAILDYNLASDTDVLAANAVRLTFDILPANTGDGSANGRDWGGFVLADTNNQTSLGGAGAFFGGNPDSRVGIAARNSGTALSRVNDATNTVTLVGDGNPDGGINESIFDQATYDDYVAWFNGGDGTPAGDPVLEFDSNEIYTVQVDIAPVSGNIFDDGVDHTINLSIGIDGGILSPIDPNPATSGLEEVFVWGDNISTAVNDPEEPLGKKAYLVFVANGPNHAFDNLIVEALGSGEILGDYNDNGLVEQGDLNQVLNNWGTDFASVSASWINQRPTEGIVDQAELNVVLNRWGSDSAPDFSGSAVPEPASLALLGAAGLLLRRRH